MKRRVAFCGTRGIPAAYGGFETAVDEITIRLQNNEYQCDVFCRSMEDREPEFVDERRIIFIKGSENRKLDTFISSINTGLYLLKNRKEYDFVFWFNNANLPGIFITRIIGIPMAVNTDGLEWRRAKWSLPFKLYYFLSSLFISLICKNLISDSQGIKDYYYKKFKKRTIMIPYGAPNPIEIRDQRKDEILQEYAVMKNKYFIQITRFEPDNLPLKVIESFIKSKLYEDGYQFLLIGYKDSNNYSEQILKYDGGYGVRVLNALYDKEKLQVLRENAFSYVHGNSVGGTNPALLEAMTSSQRVMAIDIVFSHEVLGELGTYFKIENLHHKFKEILKSESNQKLLKLSVEKKYDWNDVAEKYKNISLNWAAVLKKNREYTLES
ncbi:DUF1972 domain-containing protein [Paenibacillus sp. B01]|uniref:DUF1972 domain-containing protein n=1 Tax=Paenibacillus sp. B01 TaxID=2660554 RepID=UPI00129A42B1|nr:DUF1972 domain-containing protein [Paenibacillus sp. B01]QGG55272.1 DUF1972 domain-containing protein [Paenibacillus sp. B01]